MLGCVKLGDSDTSAAEDVVVIDGAVGTDGGGFDTTCDGVGGIACEGLTAAAAAAAYRIGGNEGRDAGAGVGRPALSILAIGCWAKFGGGGGFAIQRQGQRNFKRNEIVFHTVCC